MELSISELYVRNQGPINLHLEAGTCLGISGPSGTGKTQLLRAIADLDPNQGQIMLGDKSRDALTGPQWRTRAGMLPAEPQWWHNLPRPHFTHPADDMLGALNLDSGLLDRFVHDLSTGERQRLAIIRLLQNSPNLLLLDEPTASLDAESSARVEALIGEFREQQRATVIWVSHDVSQLKRVAQRQMRLLDGVVLEPVAA